MARKQSAPSLPAVRCAVAEEVDAKAVAPSAPRLDQAAIGNLKAIVSLRVDTESPTQAALLGRAIAGLARAECSGEVTDLLERVLDDPRVPPAQRALAAVELRRLPVGPAEDALLRHLGADESTVRLRALQSLGAIGGERAERELARLEEPTRRAERSMLLFARRVIAHRLGLRGPEPDPPRGALSEAAEEAQGRELAVRTLNRDEVAARVAGLGGADYGLVPAEDSGWRIGDGQRAWHLLFARGLEGQGGSVWIEAAPRLAALLTRTEDPTGSEAVHMVVLTTPQPGGEPWIHGYRTDGTLLFDGAVATRGESLSFAVTSVRRPGQCAYQVAAELSAKGLNWSLLRAAERHRSGRQTRALD